MKGPPSLLSLGYKQKGYLVSTLYILYLYFKRITVNRDKSMAIYNKLQIISVTGKANKIIITRLSTVYYWNKKSYNDYMQQRLKL